MNYEHTSLDWLYQEFTRFYSENDKDRFYEQIVFNKQNREWLYNVLCSRNISNWYYKDFEDFDGKFFAMNLPDNDSDMDRFIINDSNYKTDSRYESRIYQRAEELGVPTEEYCSRYSSETGQEVLVKLKRPIYAIAFDIEIESYLKKKSQANNDIRTEKN